MFRALITPPSSFYEGLEAPSGPSGGLWPPLQTKHNQFNAKIGPNVILEGE